MFRKFKPSLGVCFENLAKNPVFLTDVIALSAFQPSALLIVAENGNLFFSENFEESLKSETKKSKCNKNARKWKAEKGK